MMTLAWSKFFWSDYAADPALKLCSFAAQGLWMRMLCIAAEHDPPGYIAINGRGLAEEDIARVTGGSILEVCQLVAEMDRNGVFSRDRRGWIYSRRMINEAKMRRNASEWGKKGGNPSLLKAKRNSAEDKDAPKATLGKGLIPQKPEARDSVDKSTVADATDDPVKIIFDLGVKMLSDQGHSESRARSLIGKWREGGKRDGDVAAALVDARSRHISNLVEWMPKRLNGRGFEHAGNGSGSALVDQILAEEERRKAAGGVS